MAAACRTVKVVGRSLLLAAPLLQLGPRGRGTRGVEIGAGRKGHPYLGLVVRQLGLGGEGQLSAACVWAVWG